MAMPPADSQSAEITRFFTRAGRDPLTLAPFEVRRLEEKDVRLPSPWSPEGMKRLADVSAASSAEQFLLDTAGQLAEAAEMAGVAKTREEKQILHDETAWVLAKGMMWVVEEAEQTVAVINLAHFCEPVSQNFDLANLRYVVKLGTTLAAARSINRSQAGRFSVAWTNLGGLLLSAAIPYDSSRAAGLAGNIAAIIFGETVAQSSRLAGLLPHLRHDPTRTRAGLEYAKRKVDELPLTRQVTLSANERDAWQQEAISSLNTALEVSLKNGVLNEIPVSPRVPIEANSWMGPISRGAEAIPTLEIPDVASRPEVKNVMRAIGLVDSLKGPFLGALAQGKDLEAVGVPKDKVGAMRTAKGTVHTFHPNSQIKMAEAVQPFVAGPLQHRIHLPEGVPAGFLQSLKEYGVSAGLAGLEFGEEADAGSLTLAENGVEEAPEADPIVVPVPTVDEEAATASSQIEPDDEGPASEDTAPEVAEVVVDTPEPIQEDESPSEVQVEASDETPAAPEEQPGLEEQPTLDEEAPVVDEAVPEVEPEVAEEPSPQIEASVPAPPPVPAINWEAAAAGTLGAAAVGAAVAAQPEAPAEEEAVTADGEEAEEPVVAEVAPAAEEALSSVEVLASTEPSTDVVVSDEASVIEGEAQPPVEELESGLEPVAEEEVISEQEPAGEEAAAALESQEEPVEEEALPELEPLATQTFRLNRDSGRHLVHAITDLEGRLVEVAVTSRDLGPNPRALVDSWCAAVSVGLQKGATIQDFQREITQPGLVRDVLDVLSRAFPEAD